MEDYLKDFLKKKERIVKNVRLNISKNVEECEKRNMRKKKQ